MKETKEIKELINTNQIAICNIGKELNRIKGRITWLEENLKTNGFIKKD